MINSDTEMTKAAEGEFVLARTFDVPRELMIRAWTEPDRLMQWWGPKGFKVLTCKIELAPGSVFHYGLQSPNGDTIWGKWIFQEVALPERLVYVASFSDEEGGVTRHPMAPGWPLEMLSTMTFEEQDGRTTLVLRAIPVNALDEERKLFADNRDNMKMGWTGTLDQLEEYLTKAQA